MSIYSGHCVDDHEEFLHDTLLPEIVDYALASSTPIEVVVLATFLCLATILQSKGLSRATLIQVIDAARLPMHEAPETIQ